MIPERIKKEINRDEFYRVCCITGRMDNIVLHHPFYYGKNGKQINEIVVPVTESKHARVGGDTDSVHNCKKTKDRAKWVAINRADINELKIKYPKFDWQKEKDRLNLEFGAYE